MCRFESCLFRHITTYPGVSYASSDGWPHSSQRTRVAVIHTQFSITPIYNPVGVDIWGLENRKHLQCVPLARETYRAEEQKALQMAADSAILL